MRRITLALLASLAAVALLPWRAGAQVTPNRWQAAATEFLWRLERGAFDSAASTVVVVPGNPMSAERLQQIWGQLEAQVGALRELTPAGERAADTLRVVEVDARFERAPLRFRVTLTSERRIAGFFIVPATPAAPSPPPPYGDTTAFREVAVTIGEGRWQLPGTLSLPASDRRVAAVVLVHGSGPNDRDGTAGAFKPLRDLAWGLASRGFAVLRYDKRTLAHAGALTGSAITLDAEVVDDALVALALARSRPEVDSTRVFVLGHSLGGMLAPAIAARDGRLAGAILLAAPARSILEVLPEQLDYLASIAGSAAERAQLATLRERAAAIATGSLPADSVVLGAPVGYWRELAAVDPVARARGIRTPLLILQGERDYQATMVDFSRWRESLAGRDGVTMKSYPTLNHFFAAGTGRATPAELARGGYVAEEVIGDLATWIGAAGR
jgi:hypothetical protein